MERNDALSDRTAPTEKRAFEEVMTVTHERQATVKDPVCGMDVDPATAKHTAEYEGQTYYFCSLMCRKAFEDDPRQYLRRREGGPAASR